MKKVFYFVSLACAMMFASCSSDDDQVVGGASVADEDVISVGIGLPADEGTRVMFYGNDIQDLRWTKGDAMQAVAYNAAGMPAGTGVFNMDPNDFGKSSAVFTGPRVEGAAEYVFAYFGNKVKYSYDINADKYTVDCGYMSQELEKYAKSDFEHIKDHLYMTTPKLKVQGESIQGGNVSINNSILRINIKNLPPFYADETNFLVKFYVNYAEGVEPIAQINVNKPIFNGSDNYIYVAFDPANKLAAGGDIAFEISASDNKMIASATSVNGKDYEAGKIYTVVLDFTDRTSSWNWDLVEDDVAYEVLYEGLSDDMKGWSSEIEGATNKMWYWASRDSRLNCATARSNANNSDITGYAISPAIQLANNNKVSFNQVATKIADQERAQLLVRENGTDNWTRLEIPFINPAQDIMVPAEFNGKTVQFAFMMSRAAKAPNSNWKIWNFKVEGSH